MLLFNQAEIDFQFTNKYFNTSNVTIQLSVIGNAQIKDANFNTSNVTIQRSSINVMPGDR